MSRSDERRRRIACCLVLSLVGGLGWSFAPGVPVLWGPHAGARAKETGRSLFERRWEPGDALARGDGLGPVFNARSCTECHSQAGIGGGGSSEHNVTTFEVLPTRRQPRIERGAVHAFAVAPAFQETQDVVHRLFPVQPGQPVLRGCSVSVTDFDPVLFDSVNPPALFGTGWIDRISAKSITYARRERLVSDALKEFQLDFHTIPAGRARLLPDGRIGKFGWKAQFATLREFVAAACANELGLGNPVMDQARPLGASGKPPAARDLDRVQLSALVAFVATLPQPAAVLPERPAERSAATRGEQLFTAIGCAACHTPDLGGVKGVYSDFLLHRVAEPARVSGYELGDLAELALAKDEPRPDEWKTPPLWGVADSAPYFHDGGSATLEDAILRHSGDASRVTAAYHRLAPDDRAAVVTFLKTLRAPPDSAPAATQLARVQ